MTPSNISNGKERNVDRSPVIGELVGESEPIRQVRQDIEIAASLDLNVLIIGEPGTGKELVAPGLPRTGLDPGTGDIARRGGADVIGCGVEPLGAEVFFFVSVDRHGTRRLARGRYADGRARDRSPVFGDDTTADDIR